MSKKQYKLTVEPVTAVHIGTGQEITPLDYLVVKTKQGNDLYCKYTSDKILSRLLRERKETELAEFERISLSGNMKEMRDFFHKAFSPDDIDYLCGMTKEFSELYEKNRKKDPCQNAASVLPMYRPEGLKTPVIPGSSLKGAIRTAVLNKLLYDFPDEKYDEKLKLYKNCRRKGNFDSDLQKAMLDDYTDAKEDPFRCVEIADCKFNAKNSQIVGVLKNIKSSKGSEIYKPTEKAASMQIQAEVIKGRMTGSCESGETILRINSDLQLCNRPASRHGTQDRQDSVPLRQITKSISAEEIIAGCNTFYLTQLEKEYEKFYKESDDSEYASIPRLYKTLTEIARADSDSFIMRVGRWSQVEFVTFGSDFRCPKVREGRGYGDTRTVFNYDGQYLPMGWCKCTLTE